MVEIDQFRNMNQLKELLVKADKALYRGDRELAHYYIMQALAKLKDL